MPQATDLVINDGQATPVARTFVLITPASGDGSAALWQYKAGANSSVFPKIIASARKNAQKNARKLEITVSVPFAVVDNQVNIVKPGPTMMSNSVIVVPDDFPEAAKADAVAFICNAFANSLFKAMIRDAVPAT